MYQTQDTLTIGQLSIVTMVIIAYCYIFSVLKLKRTIFGFPR